MRLKIHASCRWKQLVGSTARIALITCGLVGISAGRGFAQTVTNSLNVGIPENGVFTGSDFDNIQLNNLDLHIELPLYSVKGRGLNIATKMAYDNKGWYLKTHCDRNGFCTDNVTPELDNDMHWTIASPVGYSIYSKFLTQYCNPTNYLTYIGLILREPDSTKHHFVPDPAIIGNGNNCFGPVGMMYADDGSGWLLKMDPNTAAILYAVRKDGTIVNLNYNPNNQWSQPGKLVEDSNGNQLIYPDPANNLTGSFTDTLGRSFTPTTYYDSSGTSRTIQITYMSVAIQTALCGFSGADQCIEYAGTWLEPQVVTLPNGMTYQFTYDQAATGHPAYGEPLSVTLPTGGQISWTWGAPIDASGRIVATRTATVGGQSFTWNYVSSGTSSVTDPLGNQTQFTCTWTSNGYKYWPSSPPPLCYIGLMKYYWLNPDTGQLVLLKTVQTDYSTAGAVIPIHETTTLNQTNLVTKVETDWDSMSAWPGPITWKNPVARREYAYGSGAPGALVRNTTFSYLHLTNSTYLNVNIADKPNNKIVKDGGGNTIAQTSFSYDGSTPTGTSGAPNHDYTNFSSNYNVRGNATTVSRWLNTTGGWLSTTNTYDDLGNPRSTTDPKNNLTSFSYTDNFTDGTNRNAQAFVTQTTYPTTNGVSHIERKQYYWNTSLVAASCGQNFPSGSTCTNAYSPPEPDYTKYTYDLMNRSLSVTQGDGGQITFTYSDTSQPVNFQSTQTITGSLNKITTTVLDGLGRVKQTQLNTDPDGITYVDITYDALGRKATVSNPHRTASLPTDGTTTYQYDALNRATKLIPPDGNSSSNNVITTYSGNCTTVTDQAGKVRKSCADALGRLTTVWEDPSGLNYETDYQYDTLDNLTSVVQSGSRQRTFVYDSLSRLTSATNPEPGMIQYTYDGNGNLLTKQDARGITTTYSGYDGLNRPAGKTYSNGDPAVSYSYDQSACLGQPTCYNIGRRTGMSDAAGSEAWSYDTMGRVLTDQRTTNSVTKSTVYAYNFDSSAKTITYPSNRTVTYAPGGAGRPLSAKDSGNSINYALSATYAPQGALASTVLGQTGSFTGINLNFGYDKRLQPTTIRGWSTTATALDLAYNFNLGTSDNGNVIGITNNRDGTRSQTFSYDSLNRILVGETTSTHSTSPANCWGETYLYDNQTTGGAWGNLTNINVAATAYNGCIQENLNISVNTQNRITTSGYGYDAAGNTTSTPAPLGGTYTYTYNAENQMTQATTGSTTNYVYDGDEKRVQKSNGKLYWYGTGSDPLDETDSAGNLTSEYVFFGGKRIARLDWPNPNTSIFYYFEDHLGTSRVITNATGTVCYDADFYPFGGERTPIVNTCPQNYKFTGKERDTESGLDNFGARYDSSNMGRFMSPDPVTITPERFYDPQQLNAYAYVRNNPLRLVDPTGMILQLFGNSDHDLQDLCSIVGADNCSRISVNDQGIVSFDAQGLDLSNNAGANLINDLVQSQNHYGFSEGPTVDTAGGTIKVDYIANLDNRPDDRYSNGKRDIDKPKSDIDDIVAINRNPNGILKSLTDLKLALRYTVAFHELAEAFAKIDGGKQYEQAHNDAMKREDALRDQRPYLRQYNPGSGGPAGKPDNEIIIKNPR